MPVVIPALRDQAVRDQIFLEGLKSSEIASFNSAYMQIEDRVRSLLSGLEVSNLGEADRVEVEKVIARLERESVAYGQQAIDELALGMTDYSKYASEYEAAKLSGLFTSTTARAVGAKKLMKATLAQPVPLGDGTAVLLGDMYANLKTREAKRLGASVRNSWLANKSVVEATRDVVGSKASGYSNGVLAISRRNAAAVVHTSYQHLSSTARFETYETNDDLVVGYEWVSTLDGSTTSQCRTLDGRRFLFKKAGYQPRPPLHVRCRSTTTPVLDDGLDFLDEGATRSSREGYVSAKETYYDWLKRQPASEQKKILGRDRSALFDKMTAERFSELQLDKNFQPRTLDEMKKLAPAAFKRAGLN